MSLLIWLHPQVYILSREERHIGFGDLFGGLPRVEVKPHADWSMDGMRRLMGWGVGGGWGGGG